MSQETLGSLVSLVLSLAMVAGIGLAGYYGNPERKKRKKKIDNTDQITEKKVKL